MQFCSFLANTLQERNCLNNNNKKKKTMIFLRYISLFVFTGERAEKILLLAVLTFIALPILKKKKNSQSIIDGFSLV